MAKFKGKKLNKHERHELKQAKKNKVMAIVIIIIFGFSLFGVAMLQNNDSPNNIVLNGYTFGTKQIDDYYVWQIISGPNKDHIGKEFYYVPNSGYENTFDSEKVLTLLDAPYVYLSVNPIFNTTEEAQALAIQDLARVELKNILSEKVVVNSVETEYEDSLKFGCSDATENATVVSFIDSSETEGIFISESNPYCINIIASSTSLMRYVDMIKFAIIENE